MRFPIHFRDEVQWDEAFDRSYFKAANRHGHIVKLKQMMGIDVNKSIFERFRK